jgi:1,4-dihydroxy-2-naphthoyl-CoA synthase
LLKGALDVFAGAGIDAVAGALALAPRAGTQAEAAPLAQRATKEVAWRTADMGWIESVRFGETMRKVAGATDDVAEGLAAWREKRKPQWRGR